jgi:hypothetical protein
VYLYSVNNSNKVDISEGASDAEKTNAETKQQLIDINQSLFFAESQEFIDLLIPFDKIEFGKNIGKCFGAYNKDLLFHQSAIQSLVKQNIYKLIQDKNKNLDMAEFAHKSKYQGSPLNITLP